MWAKTTMAGIHKIHTHFWRGGGGGGRSGNTTARILGIPAIVVQRTCNQYDIVAFLLLGHVPACSKIPQIEQQLKHQRKVTYPFVHIHWWNAFNCFKKHSMQEA